MTNEQRLEYTLWWVNKTREEYNIGPALTTMPVGVRGDECECPVARALGGQVNELEAHWPDELIEPGRWEHVALPYDVRKFIAAFDHGEYRFLEEGQPA